MKRARGYKGACGRTAFLVAILSTILVTAALAAEKFQKLAGSQIGARLAGMEMTDEVHSADVFERNGVLTSYEMGRKTTGRWRVNKDMLCLERAKNEAQCYEVWLAGKKIELRQLGSDLPLDGILQRPVSRW